MKTKKLNLRGGCRASLGTSFLGLQLQLEALHYGVNALLSEGFDCDGALRDICL